MIKLQLLKRLILIGVILFFVLMAFLAYLNIVSFSSIVTQVFNGLILASCLAIYEVLFKPELVQRAKKLRHHFKRLWR